MTMGGQKRKRRAGAGSGETVAGGHDDPRTVTLPWELGEGREVMVGLTVRVRDQDGHARHVTMHWALDGMDGVILGLWPHMERMPVLPDEEADRMNVAREIARK